MEFNKVRHFKTESMHNEPDEELSETEEYNYNILLSVVREHKLNQLLWT